MNTQTAADLLNSVVAIANNVLPFAIALAAVGSLSMVLLEVLKMLVSARVVFNCRSLTLWFVELCEGRASGTAYGDLLSLCTGVNQRSRQLGTALANHFGKGMEGEPTDDGQPSASRQGSFRTYGSMILGGWLLRPEYSVFALEGGQLFAVLQEAVDVALANPSDHPELFAELTRGARPSDVATWTMRDTRSWTQADSDRSKLELEAFARIRLSVTRRIDGFQNFATVRWGSINQLSANAIGSLIMFSVLFTGFKNLHAPLLFSVFGGLLAPVARDVVTALKQVTASQR